MFNNANRSIPKIYLEGNQSRDVVTTFLMNFTWEVIHYFQPAFDEIKSVYFDQNQQPKKASAHEIESLHKKLINMMKEFPPIHATINSSMTTFALLSSRNIISYTGLIGGFYPPVIGYDIPKSQTTIFDYFATIETGSDEYYLIAFLSESLFCLLLMTLIDKCEKIDQSICGTVLQRFLNRSNLPSYGTFGYDTFLLINRLNSKLLKFFCESNAASDVIKIFSAFFPKPNISSDLVLMFFQNFSGVCFDSINAKKLTNEMSIVIDLMLNFKSNDIIMDFIFQFLYNILPVYVTDANAHSKLLASVEKITKDFIKNKVTWRSSLRLMGVIHYFNFPDTKSKYFKDFWDKKVLKRFAKSHKSFAALEYCITLFKPSKYVNFNKNRLAFNFFDDQFKKIFSHPFSNCQKLASKLLSIFAKTDLSRYANEFIPQLLNPGSKSVTIALMSIESILNPLYNPVNALSQKREEISTFYSVLMERVYSWSIQMFPKALKYDTKCAYDFIPAAKIIPYITVKESKSVRNDSEISSNILYFLHKCGNFKPIRKVKKMYEDDLANAKETTKTSLGIWKNHFETPIDYFGAYNQKKSIKFKEMKATHTLTQEVQFCLLIPIILYHGKNFNYFVDTLLLLITHDSRNVSSIASIIFESLFLFFPSDINQSLFETLFQKISSLSNANCQSRHIFYIIFLHILQNNIQTFDREYLVKVLSMADYVALQSLCSPFPETRMLSFDIIESSSFIVNILEEQEIKELNLLRFIKNHSNIVESGLTLTIISSFSSVNQNNCITHNLPAIPLKAVALSPYIIIWKYMLKEIAETLLKQHYYKFIIDFREIILKQLIFLHDRNEAEIFMRENSIDNLHYVSNLISFLFVTGTPIIEEINFKHKWREQKQQIVKLLELLTECVTFIPDEAVHAITFVYMTINIDLFEDVTKIFFKFLDDQNKKTSRRDYMLGLFSLVLRNFALSSKFSNYIGKFTHKNIISRIHKMFDNYLNILYNNGSELDIGNHKALDIVTNYLVFKSQYFKFIHQSKIQNQTGPIIRCPISIVTDQGLISPTFNKNDMFNLLLAWSLYGQYTKGEVESCNTIKNFNHISKMTLNYLVSLTNFFTDDLTKLTKEPIKEFMTKLALISNKNVQLLKYLLSHHYNTFIDEYFRMALEAPLEISTRFMSAISYHFNAVESQNSIIYNHETFIRNISTSSSESVEDTDCEFFKNVFYRGGVYILIGLFYMLHSKIEHRQSATLIIVNVLIPICAMYYLEDGEKIKEFGKSFEEYIQSIPSQIKSTRSAAVLKLSEMFSEYFSFYSEQLINIALRSIAHIPPDRDDLSSHQMLEIITPWFKNIHFDFSSRTITKNVDSFPQLIYYSPITFLNELTTTLQSISNPIGLGKSEMQLWKNLTDSEDNLILTTVYLTDYGVTHKSCRQFVSYVLTFFYHLNSDVVSYVAPLLFFGNWYFSHVQLGKFEEIDDMNEFLSNMKNSPQNVNFNVDINKTLDNYMDSTQFAIQILTEFAQEDVLSLINYYYEIVIFCLIRLNQRPAFDLLHVLLKSIMKSVESGIPECLLNAYELFNHISFTDFDKLTFVTEDISSPFSALQEKRVSISEILKYFIDIYVYYEFGNSINSHSDILLLWGTSCGDLTIASIALQLYSKQFSSPDTNSTILIIESISIISRCVINVDPGSKSVKKAADYISSGLKALNSIANKLVETEVLQNIFVFSWLCQALIELDGEFLKLIINDVLILFITLLNSDFSVNVDVYSRASYPFSDFKGLFLKIITKCADISLLVRFIVSIIKAPRKLLSCNNDYSIYLIPFLPLLWTIVTDNNRIASICSLSDIFSCFKIFRTFYDSQHLSEILDHIESQSTNSVQTFANELIETLTQSFDKSFFVLTSTVLASMLNSLGNVLIDSIFALCREILAMYPTQEVFKELGPVTSTAILGYSKGIFIYQIEYLRTALSSDGAYHLDEVITVAQPKTATQNKNSLRLFEEIEKECSKVLHTNYKDHEGSFMVRFDSIEKYPPMFPFDIDFLKTTVAVDIANLCRRIEVEPYSVWFHKLYSVSDLPDAKHKTCSTVINEMINTTTLAKVIGVVKDIMSYRDDSEHDEIIEKERCEEKAHTNHLSEFLPSFAEINQIQTVGDVKIIPIPT